MTPKVYICSAYRSDDIEERVENQEFAADRCADAVGDGYLPIAPHLYLPRFLNDWGIEERFAIRFCLELMDDCKEVWVYGDPTEGMIREIDHAKRTGKRIVCKER